jgi:hypothetical protein
MSHWSTTECEGDQSEPKHQTDFHCEKAEPEDRTDKAQCSETSEQQEWRRDRDE